MLTCDIHKQRSLLFLGVPYMKKYSDGKVIVNYISKPNIFETHTRACKVHYFKSIT